MFAFDDAPTTTSLLLQCGYRSKVCTNLRATKLDGSLHKLCEFHRRKANANQQKLHKRQREERALQEQNQQNGSPSAKRSRRSYQPVVVEPVRQDTSFQYCFSTEDYQGSHHYQPQSQPCLVDEQSFPKLTWEDMDILEVLLQDMQTLPLLETIVSDNKDDQASTASSVISL